MNIEDLDTEIIIEETVTRYHRIRCNNADIDALFDNLKDGSAKYNSCPEALADILKGQAKYNNSVEYHIEPDCYGHEWEASCRLINE